jgi:hypothetical protein
MHCIFITRCYKATNIQTIKENLKEVFNGSKHDYELTLICDLTHGASKEDFDVYSDKKTSYTIWLKEQTDVYCTKNIDLALSMFYDEDMPPYYVPEKSYVYILDDDNQITPDFLAALDACEDGEPDVVVFKVYGHPQWGEISILDQNAVGKIDWANMLVRLDVMRRLKVYTLGADSQKSDGLFFEKMKKDGCTIKFLNQICGRYNALPKP